MQSNSLCFLIFCFQDNYYEEAFKMRNVLEEFLQKRVGRRKPTILGLREHIFTGRLRYHLHFELFWFCKLLDIFLKLEMLKDSKSEEILFKCKRYYNHVLNSSHSFYSVSSLAWFMSNQETSFVTIGQRILANPLRYAWILFLKWIVA